MFSFFAKKPVIAPENVPLPQSPPPQSKIIQDAEPSQVASGSHVQQQLRTPSPSIASGSAAHGAHPSPAPTVSNISSSASNRAASPSRAAEANTADVPIPPEVTPESLTSLLLSVPAKILHAYTLSHIPDASEDTIRALTSFFDTLTPPPKLHCVRCHKDYVEVDNDDRSCLVPHDDDSAEVERVGRVADARKINGGTEYETLWGCCGKTTEGNGDQGPPDGFCYEGKHTIDVKRARFRADSTAQNDKLVSCLRLNCHGVRDTLPRSSARKRPRSSMNYKEAISDDDGSEGDADSGMEEMVNPGSSKAKPKSKARPKAKGKGKAKEGGEDKMDVDEEEDGEPDSASRASSVRGKAKGKAKAPVSPAAPASTAPKRRGRPTKAKASPRDSDGESVATSVKSVAATTKGRRRRPLPKSKEFISDSEDERGRSVAPRGSGSKPVSPSRAPATGPRTRSQSRSRVATIVSKLEASSAPSGSNVTKTPVKPAPSKNVVPETGDEEEDKQPKKKRKVAS